MEIDSIIVIPVRSKRSSAIAEDKLFPDAPLCKAQYKMAKSKLTANYLYVAAGLLAAAKRTDHIATVGPTSSLYDGSSCWLISANQGNCYIAGVFSATESPFIG